MRKKFPCSFLQFDLVIPILFLFLFFLFSLGYYFSTHVFFGFLPYDAKRILELILLISLNGYFIASRAYSFNGLRLFLRFSFVARILIISILIFGIISSCLSAVPKMAFLEVALYVLLFFLTMYVAVFRARFKRTADYLFIALILISAAIYLFNFFSVYIHSLHSQPDLQQLFAGFMNIRFFAQYQVWTITLIFLPLFFITRQKKVVRVLIYLLSAFWLVLLFVNAAEGMFVALLLSAILVGVIFRKRSTFWFKVYFKVFLFSVLIFMLFLFVVFAILMSKGHALHFIGWLDASWAKLFCREGRIVSRLILFQKALVLFMQHPLFGVGPMHFAFYQVAEVSHPHNSVALILSEWGGFVLIFSLILFFRGFCFWCQFAVKQGTPIVISLSAAFFAAVIYSLCSGVLITPLSQVMLCLVLGWMLGIYFEGVGFQGVKITLISKGLWAVTFLIAVAAIIIVLSPMITTLPSQEAQWYLNKKQNIYHEFAPRFWIQGWIKYYPKSGG